eukprot:Tbor_TRINITY_DN5768_c0_g1::TRINITY_DN5768_c0_g1_i1::g.19562::m.19562
MSSEPSNKKPQVFSIKTRKPINEEDLLTEEDRQEKTANKEDCTTRRKACKNCVCGRAELEKKLAAEGMDIDASDNQPPAGGCGNCSRGDAFRCAGCPYLGTPAFVASGEGGIKLNLMDDV